ncbi:isopeptide-forming domain-containing fimbrial protein [Virgibacillus sp. AGTR]|uniref:isopeptide-forming domain-containing fimbrial protein n=1 Tax=Virgibacillus sp. AGTR TaxID=2812055 RepID=UPI001D164347|nr:isopeptide-forming domain-containing fimbrial protein [Virgibacillus sp. AGTR]MCC2252093.1 isopeptide-forming domain-containing fimbrial protein [Virgibacillus sp. AGTR]
MQRQCKLWFRWFVFSVGMLGVLIFTSNVSAAVTVGDILDGHADVPKDNDVASSKYAVIAQFGSKSELILSGATTKKSNNGRDLFVEPSNNKKGKIKALYTNVGTYKGKSLDFELIVDDWEEAGFNGGEFFLFYDTHIGFKQGGYEYVSLRGTYKYSDTGKPATDLTGSYMTVNDLDANQFMTFDSNMINKIDKIYAYGNSWVSYWKRSGKTNIGARFNQALDPDDERGIITMLVSGYEFDFEWHKDWSRPSSNNQYYNFDRTLNWRNEASGQYFGYISEKPVRTEVLDPTKKIIDGSGKQRDSTTITAPDSFTYEVYHTVPSEYPKFFYDSYVMKDVIHGALSIDDVKVYNSDDKDVTSRFTIRTHGQTITATAKGSTLSNKGFYGKDYRFVMDVTVDSSPKLLDYADGDDHFIIKNTATVTVDGKEKSTNDVKTTVKLPRTDIGMEKIQIYTDKADAGLPVRLDIKTKNDVGMYDDDIIKIELYEKHDGTKTRVETKKVALKDIADTINMKIPDDGLRKDAVRNYEAVIAEYNKHHIRVKDNVRVIDTDGHTAKEGVITTEKPFTGVVMTERKLGENMKEYTETVGVSYEPTPRVKSGYGIEVTAEIAYGNEKLADVARVMNVNSTVDANVAADYPLIDRSLAYYDSDRRYEDGDTIAINLLRKQESLDDDTSRVTYQLPRVFLEQHTGYTFTQQQKANGSINGEAINAGHKLYIPVWVDALGTYNMAFQSSEPIGSHRMRIDVNGSVYVYAYMFHHTDSETPEEDEILLHPIPQEDNPFDW